MCGLTGFLGTRTSDAGALDAALRNMTRCLTHRGPDGEGYWVDPEAGVGLGHRRLAILDLSPAGQQPMVSHSGRYVISYNGEIYNFAELRAELESAGPSLPWRGSSDTEVALACFERWGLEGALERFNGMFALALWDRQERRLHLARDRFGEKPLYYAVLGSTLLFASELKALTAHPEWHGDIDRAALRAYMRFNYIPSPRTIYDTARKLPASSVLTVTLRGPGLAVGEPRKWWSPTEVALAAREQAFTDQRAAEEECLDLLARVVRSRMVSDVPLGAFLSGGIDSSLVVAAMQAPGRPAARTFTIGFEDPQYDESAAAAAVAQVLHTRHACHPVTPREAQQAIMRIPTIYDEPFADSSQIPTYLVSKAAREHVTVALTGDGGDELFGGYHRYFVGQRVFPKLRALSPLARRPLAAAIRMLPPAYWESILRTVRRVHGAPLSDLSGERLHRLARQLEARSNEGMYEVMMARPDYGAVSSVDSGGTGHTSPTSGWTDSVSAAEAMMLFDTLNILPDDFLVKVDRASMSVGLETRAPLLDPALFALAWRLPLSWKLGPNSGKLFMRRLLARFVPDHIVERPKQGFSIPVGPWLKGPLRDWAETLLDEHRLRSDGFLEPGPLRRRWAEHLSGTHDRQNEIWSALVFQQWLASSRGSLKSEPRVCLA